MINSLILFIRKQKMDDFYQLSESQQEKVFQLMQMMGVNNIEIAHAVLSINNWNLQRALQSFLSDSSGSPQISKQPSNKSEPDEWQKFDPTQALEMKIEDFNSMFPEVKLSQQVSDMLMNRRTSTTKDEEIRIQQYVDKLIKDNPKFAYTLEKSQRQMLNNKRFIQYLNKEYKPSINFALGSFSSNLMKSFVKKKPLLVYVHRTTDSKSANNILTRILQDAGISKFINSNFVIYGMFDNSEDYSIVQPELPLTNLPGFAIYVYDDKTKNEKCLGSRTLLRNEPRTLVGFMNEILEKVHNFNKTPQNSQQIQKIHENAKQSERKLKDEQQEIYDQMEQQWKMKREESKLRKVNKAQAKAHVDSLKKQFQKEPQLGAGVIQLRLRLPVTGKLLIRNFQQKNKVHDIFVYVEAFCSEDFENEFGDFDLVQTYPPLSLLQKEGETLENVFDGSTGQTLIVKEI